MTNTAPRLDGRSWTYLLVLSVLWSASFIFIKVAAVEIPVLTLVLSRVGLAALALHCFMFFTGRRYPRDPAMLLRYLVMGLSNNVLPFALIVYATAHLGAGSASILNATSPIFALVIAHIATADEKITAAKLVGILFGIVGVAAMVGPEAALAGLRNDDLTPAAAMLLASSFYGLSSILGRSFRGIDATVSATCQLTASTLVLLPITLLVDQPWTLPVPNALALTSALALAILSTSLAYVIFYALIRRAGGTNAILVTLLIPVGGVFFAWVLLGEAFTPSEAAGMLLIGLGLMTIDGRALRLFLSSGALGRGKAIRPGSAP